jgi:hypothetical protein
MALPGISFEIVQSAGPLLGIRADRTAMVALTERGPVETPVLVHSLDEYAQVFGCPVHGMLGPLGARGYYANGGQELIVSRFVPAEATSASGALGVVGASQAPGFQITILARDPGAFGNRFVVDALITVRRRAKGTASDTDEVEFTDLLAPLFTPADVGLPVLLSHGATTWTRIAAVSPLVLGAQTVTFVASPLTLAEPVLVELYEPTFSLRLREPGRANLVVSGLDLRDLTAARELVAPIGLDLNWMSTAGLTELPLPGVRVRLTGGDDGLDPSGDLLALEASFQRALAALDASDLPDIVIAPDLWSRIFRTKGVDRLAFEPARAIALGDTMVLAAEQARDRIVLLDPPLTGPNGLRPLAPSELEPWRAERVQTLLAARDFAATYASWPRTVAGPVYKGDDTLLVPPSAYVAGRMALVTRERGPWIATGNIALEEVIGIDLVLSEADQQRLQAVGINPLRVTLPRGVTIQGVRSLSYPDRAEWQFISTRRLFNFLRRALRPIGLSYVFEPNAPPTWIQLRRDVERLLRDLYAAGALAGARPDQAFFVKVDEALNPEPARESGILTCQIGVAPALPLEFLLVRLVVSRGTAHVTEEPIVP